MMFHTPQKRIPKLHLSINNIDIEKVDSFNFLGLVFSLRYTFEVELSRQESSKQANTYQLDSKQTKAYIPTENIKNYLQFFNRIPY